MAASMSRATALRHRRPTTVTNQVDAAGDRGGIDAARHDGRDRDANFETGLGLRWRLRVQPGKLLPPLTVIGLASEQPRGEANRPSRAPQGGSLDCGAPP